MDFGLHNPSSVDEQVSLWLYVEFDTYRREMRDSTFNQVRPHTAIANEKKINHFKQIVSLTGFHMLIELTFLDFQHWDWETLDDLRKHLRHYIQPRACPSAKTREIKL